jgi:integrase/recombinase XerD
MAHRKASAIRPPIGDERDPNSLYNHMRHFLAWRMERQFSAQTVAHDEECLRYFIVWADERGLGRPQEITRPILERYQRYLFLYRKTNGQPLSARTQYSRLTPLRAFFAWLARHNHILYNPASDLDLPRMGQRLPKHIHTVADVEAILAMPDLDDPLGIRDRAMLETLYSTGMRRLELAQLEVFGVDHERGTVMIRQGKGKKDRMVPIGERALAWIAKYRDDVRPELVAGPDEGTLFLTHTGAAFTVGRLSALVRDYIDGAKIGKRGSCHLFRHTMATLMLENGADIRFIQAMLGHASLSTTQLYTQVSIRKLKDIHTATHPGRVIGALGAGAGADDGDGDGERAALLDMLDDEADEEE